MSDMPIDHGSDRYGYVELQNAPDGIRPGEDEVTWLLREVCQDCNPNLFLRYVTEDGASVWTDSNGNRWAVVVAHDGTCPWLMKHERKQDG